MVSSTVRPCTGSCRLSSWLFAWLWRMRWLAETVKSKFWEKSTKLTGMRRKLDTRANHCTGCLVSDSWVGVLLEASVSEVVQSTIPFWLVLARTLKCLGRRPCISSCSPLSTFAWSILFPANWTGDMAFSSVAAMWSDPWSVSIFQTATFKRQASRVHSCSSLVQFSC